MIRPYDAAPEGSGFATFRLAPPLLRAVAEAGFDTPRPIQTATIPACLAGRDVMGLAQTGTGKTAAFALPILQRLLERPGDGPRALVLSPTRELARQIDAEFHALARFTKLHSTTVFGGVATGRQVAALRRRPEVVVGCPGRVLDLLQQGALDLSRVETLVLDEADQMFDMGFLPDVKRIVGSVPKNAQRLLFSATMPSAVRDLADALLHEPHVVELAPARPAETIDHYLCPTSTDRKRELLDVVLADEACRTAIVFTRTKHRARKLARELEQQGRRAIALQGNMSQPQRDRAMQGFRDGAFDILVATDIAARGLDVAGVSHVINFDPPSTPEIYTHRIGRTGRSGASGVAYTLVTSEDRAWARATERVLGQEIPLRRYDGFDAGRPPLDRAAAAPAPRREPAPARRTAPPAGDGAPPRDRTSRHRTPPQHAPRQHAFRPDAPQRRAPQRHAGTQQTLRDAAPPHRDGGPREPAFRDATRGPRHGAHERGDRAHGGRHHGGPRAAASHHPERRHAAPFREEPFRGEHRHDGPRNGTTRDGFRADRGARRGAHRPDGARTGAPWHASQGPSGPRDAAFHDAPRPHGAPRRDGSRHDARAHGGHRQDPPRHGAPRHAGRRRDHGAAAAATGAPGHRRDRRPR